MARPLITKVAFLGFAAWSMLGILGLGLVSLGGGILRFLVQALFAGDPDTAMTADGIAHFIEALGGGVIIFAWVTGGVVIAIGASIFNRLSAVEVHGARFDWQPETWQATEREMKDVTPPRERPSGEMPRLPRPHDKN
jgi:hypothetical protein